MEVASSQAWECSDTITFSSPSQVRLVPLPIAFTNCPLLITIGAARRRAVVVNEQVQIRNVIKLTLTLDHRYTDGGQVSGIYGNCVRYLEDPEKCVEDDAVAWGKTAAAATTTTTARIATKKGSSHET